MVAPTPSLYRPGTNGGVPITTGPIAAKLKASRRLPVPAMRKAIRIANGLSQGDIAQQLEEMGYKVDRVTVTRWEKGVRTPRGELLIAYVALLDELQAEQS